MRGGWTDWMLMAAAALLLMAALLWPFQVAVAMPLTEEEMKLKAACDKGKLIRLHVVAHSDSKEDQAIKLAVRDSVIRHFGSILSRTGSCSYEEAKQLLLCSEDGIRCAAEECLKQFGCAHAVHVRTGHMQLPAKTYGQVTLPEGEYFALRITIGQGAGQNWWCVLFPQLCLVLGQRDNEVPFERTMHILQQWTALPV